MPISPPADSLLGMRGVVLLVVAGMVLGTACSAAGPEPSPLTDAELTAALHVIVVHRNGFLITDDPTHTQEIDSEGLPVVDGFELGEDLEAYLRLAEEQLSSLRRLHAESGELYDRIESTLTIESVDVVDTGMLVVRYAEHTSFFGESEGAVAGGAGGVPEVPAYGAEYVAELSQKPDGTWIIESVRIANGGHVLPMTEPVPGRIIPESVEELNRMLAESAADCQGCDQTVRPDR